MRLVSASWEKAWQAGYSMARTVLLQRVEHWHGKAGEAGEARQGHDWRDAASPGLECSGKARQARRSVVSNGQDSFGTAGMECWGVWGRVTAGFGLVWQARTGAARYAEAGQGTAGMLRHGKVAQVGQAGRGKCRHGMVE